MIDKTNDNPVDNDDVVVDEDLSKLDDTTDWRAKAQELAQKRKEDGIRSRERTKALKEKLSTYEKADKGQRPPENKSDDFGLLELAFLKSDGIKDQDEVDFVKKQLKVAGLAKDHLDQLLANPYFKSELENLRLTKANRAATSNVRGEGTNSATQNTPGYWMAKGELPPKTSENRKLRAQIAREFMKQNSSGAKKFYNE